WIETEKIDPNPFQPRREFDEKSLADLANSIRQYGVLQPLVVSRIESETSEGGLTTHYELIAGERRLRASKLAGVSQVPCVIRVGDDSMAKLELAIIENLQREDLNPIDRARAFLRLQDEFKFTHAQIGDKMGKSREYVSNTLRLLMLPQEVVNALAEKKISEGHTRPILMLNGRPEEQAVLFKEIIYKKLSVREAERIARTIATDRVRKKELAPDPVTSSMEMKLAEALGTRVHIERKENGGKVIIDFFSNEDLQVILSIMESSEKRDIHEALNRFETRKLESQFLNNAENSSLPKETGSIIEDIPTNTSADISEHTDETIEPEDLDDRTPEEIDKSEEDTDLYNIKNFSL
ncbi:MAG: ParB/RepB/Spo0J family partition protein, partial [Candidatus Pacebacteria bacterium]|nr:ParB/RepB/Spo0J family partition protein [Candidatus Paceibacterota bacterium]